MDVCSAKIVPFLLWRPGTLSVQTSRQAARNLSYRCRSIEEDENAVKQYNDPRISNSKSRPT